MLGFGRARIEEGRLVQTPTAGATGVDHRAFGEFKSPRGELASYAFGWATDADPRVGRLSIGIGAGNEGGGTFHAAVVPDDEDEDNYFFSLVDEPFEDVPEGGPDLSAEEARAHEDLRFVWAVADTVMDEDRRAWWMLHWFVETFARQSTPVFDRTEPVLAVHRPRDGDWTVVGPSGMDEDPKRTHLSHLVDEDPTLVDVLDLAPGKTARRRAPGGRWKRRSGAP